MRRPLLILVVGLLIACGGDDDVDPSGSGGFGGQGAGIAGCAPSERDVDGICVPAGVQDDGCPAGEWMEDGVCSPAGLRPEDCGEGFEHDGDVGCVAVLPAAACGPGEWAIPGDIVCRDFTDCGSAAYPSVSSGAVVYVDGAAAGPGTGTMADPFGDAQAAIDAVPDGGTVAFAAGTYDGPLLVGGKAVTIVGRCASLVTLSANAAPALTLGPGSTASAVRSIAITGDGHGVVVNDAEGIVLEDLHLFDLNGHGVHVERLSAPTEVTLRGSLVDRATDRGIYAIGATIAVAETHFRDLSAGPANMGRAVDTDLQPVTLEPNLVSVSRVFIERARELGIIIHASSAPVEHTLVRDTRPRADGRLGRAILVQTDTPERLADLAITGSVVEGGRDGGIVAAAASLVLDGVVIRDVEVNLDDGFRGYGLAALGFLTAPTLVQARHVLVDSPHEVGVANLGSMVELTSVAVRDVQSIEGAVVPGLPDIFGGRGILSQSDHVLGLSADTIVRGAAVERCREVGVGAFGGTMSMEGTLVKDTTPADTEFGRGIVIQALLEGGLPASASIRSSAAVHNSELGLFASGADLLFEGSVVDDTVPIGDGRTGGGLDVEFNGQTGIPGTAIIRDSAMRGNFSAGLFSGGASIEVSNAHIADTVESPFEGGTFGDGMVALNVFTPGSIRAVDVLVESSQRAGAASFGGTIELERSRILCAAIDLSSQTYANAEGTFVDLGDNVCGCAYDMRDCKAIASDLKPPEPPGVL